MEKGRARCRASSSKGCVCFHHVHPTIKPSHSSSHQSQIAHPPPRRDGKRGNVADLSAAEIATANMGRNGRGTELLVEHDHSGGSVGSVLTSWEGPSGELRVHGIISDPSAQASVR